MRAFGAMLVVAMTVSVTLACTPPDKEDALAIAEKQANDEQAATNTPTTPATKLSSVEQGEVIAKVNGELITLGEFERRLNAQAPFARSRYNTVERKRDFLNNMVQFEVLADEARRRGLDKDPEILLEVKQAMVRKMRAAELDKRMAKIEIPDSELRAYYDAHEADYVRPAKVRTSQIVVADEATAKALIESLKAEFAKDPTHKRRIFALKARDVSIDEVTAHLGGDMRFYATPEDGGLIDKKITDVAFALNNVGDLSEPFQSDRGWHILMLTARKQRIEKPFEEVKRNISNRLYRERRAIVERDMVEEYKKSAKIEVNDALLSTIKDPEPPADQPTPTPHSHDHGHGHKGGSAPGGVVTPVGNTPPAGGGTESKP